ncbi:MAG: DUF433 domain-containing protein [Candidatus Margulisiibacteriota bacterium]
MGTKVTKNKDIMGGIPVIKGTRVPVGLICGLMARGYGPEYISKAYGISKKQIQVALEYAADQFNGYRLPA